MKKGFTFMELLGVVVVLGLIAILTVPVIANNIEKTRMNTYKTNVQLAIDSAKEYVSKNMNNHDFPKNGLNVTLLELKKGDFLSGIIKRNDNGEIYAESIYNGRYCATGTKQDLVVERVASAEECNLLDATGPDLTLKVVKITNQSVMINAYGYDSQTKIDSYTFKVGNSSENEIKSSKGVVGYEFTGLRAGMKYEIEVEVRNEHINDKTGKYKYENYATKKKIEITTSMIGVPTFKISSNGYAASKEITINYPEIENGVNSYKIKYKDGRIEEKENVGKEEKVVMTTNGKVEAYIKYPGGEVSNSINVVGIDDEGPEIVGIDNSDKWEQKKVVKVEIADVGLGIADKPYSFDGGATWSDKNSKIYTSNQVIHFAAKDKLGNITRRDIEVTRIDRTSPTCSLKVVSGLEGENGWYRGDIVIGYETLDDKAIGINGEEVQGSGVPLGNREMKLNGVIGTKITSDGTYTVEAKVIDNAGNEGYCELSGEQSIYRDTIPPVCNGTFGGKTNWTKNQNVTVGAYCLDTVSGCSQNSFTDVINGHGMIETKGIMIRDKAGNETKCTGTFNKYIDAKAPVCNGQSGGKEYLTSNQNVTVGAHCIESGPAESGCETELFTSTISGHGLTEEKEITIRDNVGNAAVCKYTYNKYIDNNPPLCGSAFGGKSSWTGNQNVTVGVNCNETRSGSESGCLQNSFTDVINGHGKTETKSIQIKDNVGNYRWCVNTYDKYIDTQGPSCSWSGESTTWRKSATIIATCNDSDGVGCSESTLSNSWSYSNGIIKNEQLEFRVTDKVGNTNVCSRNANIYVDTEPPRYGTATGAQPVYPCAEGGTGYKAGEVINIPCYGANLQGDFGNVTVPKSSGYIYCSNDVGQDSFYFKVCNSVEPPKYGTPTGASSSYKCAEGGIGYKAGEVINIPCYGMNLNGTYGNVTIPTSSQTIYCKNGAGQDSYYLKVCNSTEAPRYGTATGASSNYTCAEGGTGYKSGQTINIPCYGMNISGTYGNVTIPSSSTTIYCSNGVGSASYYLKVCQSTDAPRYGTPTGAGKYTCAEGGTGYKAGERINIPCYGVGLSGTYGNYTIPSSSTTIYCRNNVGSASFSIPVCKSTDKPYYGTPTGAGKYTCAEGGSGYKAGERINIPCYGTNISGTYGNYTIPSSSTTIYCRNNVGSASYYLKVCQSTDKPYYGTPTGAGKYNCTNGGTGYKAGERINIPCYGTNISGTYGLYTIPSSSTTIYCRNNVGSASFSIPVCRYTNWCCTKYSSCPSTHPNTCGSYSCASCCNTGGNCQKRGTYTASGSSCNSDYISRYAC